MRDPRFQALAAQLAGYSTSLRPGDRVLLELTDIPEEMGIALIREVRKAGAMPFLRLNQSRLNREMLSGATEEQYGIIGRHRLAEMEDMDAYIEIRGGGNAFELSSVPQENMAAALGIDVDRVNVKATTEEHLGFTGDGSGMSAHAVALIEKI